MPSALDDQAGVQVKLTMNEHLSQGFLQGGGSSSSSSSSLSSSRSSLMKTPIKLEIAQPDGLKDMEQEEIKEKYKFMAQDLGERARAKIQRLHEMKLEMQKEVLTDGLAEGSD